MIKIRFYGLAAAFLIAFACLALPHSAMADPLASWNDRAAKQSIINFVDKITRQGAPEYVPPGQRIAVFDNDGTLWSEQPVYFQLYFALNRLAEMAPKHPEWKSSQAVQAALSGDLDRLAKLGHKGILEIVGLTHAGLSSQELTAEVRAWLLKARHPELKLPFVEMIYQPMVELLAYLRAHDFKTYIVSGGGVDFIRAFSQKAYGIPPEQVIGSSLKAKWANKDGKPSVLKLAQINSINDKEGKPINIELQIGRRPIMAVGNSDGDLAMLQWTAAGAGPSLMVLVHHDDAKREFAYDRKSHVGKLDKALDQALKDGWTVVSMKEDFKKVFPRNAQ